MWSGDIWRAVLVPATVIGLVALTGCSSGPSTQAQVCESFDVLASQAFQGNSGFGNPLFDAVSDLGEKASAYSDSNVQQDGADLLAIDESGSTSIAELESATTSIGSLCGGSLMSRAFTGG